MIGIASLNKRISFVHRTPNQVNQSLIYHKNHLDTVQWFLDNDSVENGKIGVKCIMDVCDEIIYLHKFVYYPGEYYKQAVALRAAAYALIQ